MKLINIYIMILFFLLLSYIYALTILSIQT